MPVEDINYIEKNGIYYIKLSRAEVEEFMQYARSFDNIKPSINSFARRKAIQADILGQDAQVMVDFAINNSQEVVDLSGLNFSNVDISDVKFSGANMQGCKFENAILDSADFSSAILDKAVFKNCRAKEAKFIKAKLNDVSIVDSEFKEVFFTDSQAHSIKIVNADLDQAVIRNADWDRAMIADSNLSNCLIDNANMANTTFDKVKLHDISARKVILHQATIKSNCNIKNIDLSRADLTYAQLENCQILNADLAEANLLKANFANANISRVRPDKAWYAPSSETLIKNTMRATKVVVGVPKVAKSAANFTKKIFSKLWESDAPAVQKPSEEPLEQNPSEEPLAKSAVSAQSHSQHYNNIVNTLNSTRLVAEDFNQAKSAVGGIIKLCNGLFDQDYFFPRANNYQNLLAQIENAHRKGYIDDSYKTGFLFKLKNSGQSTQYYLDKHKIFTNYMLKNRVENLAQEGILNEEEKNTLNKQLQDVNGQFEEEINRDLEKKILQLSAEELKPFLHVLSDPALFELMKLLGSGQNGEQTLAAWASLQENPILQKLRISKIIKDIPIDDTLLKYIGIVPSIVSLIIPMMSHEKEFPIILSGLQDMFRKGDRALGADANKMPNQAMNAIAAICSLLQQDPALRRLFTEEIEQMTQVLLGIFTWQIQESGLEVDFLNKVITFSTKLAQAENSEIFGLLTEVVNFTQNPQNAIVSIANEEKYLQLKNVVQEILPRFIGNHNNEIQILIKEFFDSNKGKQINNQIAVALGIEAPEGGESSEAEEVRKQKIAEESMKLLDGYIPIASSAVKIAGAMMDHKDEFLEVAQSVNEVLKARSARANQEESAALPLSEEVLKAEKVMAGQYLRVAVAGIKLFKQKNVREAIGAELPKIFAATNGVLESKLKSFGLSKEFAKKSVDLVANIVASDEVGKILEFAEGILSTEMIEAGADYTKLLPLIINSIQGEQKYSQLKGVIQNSLPALLEANKGNISALIKEFLGNTNKGEQINNQIAVALGIGVLEGGESSEAEEVRKQKIAEESMKLLDGYIPIAFSAVKIAGAMMDHKDEFLEVAQSVNEVLKARAARANQEESTALPLSEEEVLKAEKVMAGQYLRVAVAGIKLFKQKDVREAIGEELPKIFAATNGVLESKLKSFGLSKEFAEQGVDLVANIVASDEVGKILEFAEGILSTEMIEAGADYTKLLPLIINSMQNEQKYSQLKEIIQNSVPTLLEANKGNISALIKEFLGNTNKGEQINDQIAVALGIEAPGSLKLLDGYIPIAFSAVKIAGAMMDHKGEFLEVAQSVNAVLKTRAARAKQEELAALPLSEEEVLKAEKVMAGQYLRVAVAGIKLFKQKNVREAIGAELPKIFAATNGVLESKLKSFGLSKEFAEQGVDLVANIVASDEVGKILEFANKLLASGMIINKGVLEPNESLYQMLKGFQSGDYKSALKGFALLVGEAGKYTELKTLVQETLPKLIQDNKDQIAPLMTEFIQQTELGKRINIDVNDILKIASKKNQNLLKLANHWAQGNYMGLVKETVKLLTSPMVAGFLLEIAGKAAWSYLFTSQEAKEIPTIQGASIVSEKLPEIQKPTPQINLQDKSAINPQNDNLLKEKADQFDQKNKPKKKKTKKNKMSTIKTQSSINIKIVDKTSHEALLPLVEFVGKPSDDVVMHDIHRHELWTSKVEKQQKEVVIGGHRVPPKIFEGIHELHSAGAPISKEPLDNNKNVGNKILETKHGQRFVDSHAAGHDSQKEYRTKTKKKIKPRDSSHTANVEQEKKDPPAKGKS